MEKVIRKTDDYNLLRTVFISFKVFNNKTALFVDTNKKLLKHKKKLRFFNYIRYYVNKKKDLREKLEFLQRKTELKAKANFFNTWMTQYEIEWNIKQMKNKREENIKYSWMAALAHDVNINKTLKNHLDEKENETKRICFGALKNNLEYMREEKEKEVIAEELYTKNMKQRTIDGFKFSLLISKTLQFMDQRRLIHMKNTAFTGLKWY